VVNSLIRKIRQVLQQRYFILKLLSHGEPGCTTAGPPQTTVEEAAAAVAWPTEIGAKEGAAPAAGGRTPP